ncbi:MAG: transposase [Nanoarchaeota archaeon]|nr:transposase [Nanoarchaeota archaeon]
MNKIDKEYNLFDSLFRNIKGKTKHLIQSAKAFINNRLDKCTSLNQIIPTYPQELFECLGFKESPKERTLYRDLERIGLNYRFVIEEYTQLGKKFNFIDKEQFVDFSSAYFEGEKAELGALGYSRDNQPGKKQVAFGVSTGMNGIPSSFTIQKGNVCDKKHFKFMLKIANKVFEKDSMIVFDCGGNTEENKQKIIELGFNYLTLKPRQRSIYKKYVKLYKESSKEIFYINGIKYKCVKIKEEDNKYIFYSKNLYKKLKRNRNRKYKRELDKNDVILSKVKKGKEIERFISREGDIIAKGVIQKSLVDGKNPYITGLEGFFVLESSVDEEVYKILKLYKSKDLIEKLIRNMKEGTELRPINHITKEAIIGYLLIVFIANCIIQLSHFLSKSNVDKNLKLLKKNLNCLTVTFIYDKSAFRFSVLSNISQEIREILGDSLKEFREKPPNWI